MFWETACVLFKNSVVQEVKIIGVVAPGVHVNVVPGLGRFEGERLQTSLRLAAKIEVDHVFVPFVILRLLKSEVVLPSNPQSPDSVDASWHVFAPVVEPCEIASQTTCIVLLVSFKMI